MAKVETLRELIVWQKTMDLAEQVYRGTEQFPIEERYSLAKQLRRASSSIPANVAEGFGRHSRGAYRYHVSIAAGSQSELQTHLELAKRLALLDEERVKHF